MVNAATVEIVVPVHSDVRPIERAVSSVLRCSSERMRVSVVCHNIEASRIAERLGELTSDDRVQLYELLNSDTTPAVPRNYAIKHSVADYIGFLDSDDEFEAGALEAWLGELEGSPDVLIGQLSSESVGRIYAPAPRPGRFKHLDPVKDFLNYRTPPLGVLVHNRMFQSRSCPGYRSGFRTGEDIALGLFLWNRAREIHYSKCEKGYLVREDGSDRVTAERLTPQEQFAPVREAITLPTIASLGLRRRQAIAVKLVRTQIFGYLLGRLKVGSCDGELIMEASATLGELLQFARGTLGFLDRGEIGMVRAIQLDDPASFANAVDRASTSPALASLVPLNPLRTFAPEAVLDRERRTKYLDALFR